MKRSELKLLTRRELYEMAKAYGLAGRSRMGKDDLVDNLSRVSARKAPPKTAAVKRRMSKRRHRRSTAAARAAAMVPHESSSHTPAAQGAQAAPQVYIDRGPELSTAYGRDMLEVMVRDPNWIYAYWDLSGGVRDRLSGEASGGMWVLRVYNLCDEAYEDVPVLLEGGNWYLPVASDTEYRIEIGVIDQAGTFHLAAASSPVRTPRMGISETIDEEWMILEEEFRRLMDLSGSVADQMSGSRMLSEVVSGRYRLAGLHSAGISSLGGSRRG